MQDALRYLPVKGVIVRSGCIALDRQKFRFRYEADRDFITRQWFQLHKVHLLDTVALHVGHYAMAANALD
ncbi:MAG: hypothetical protein BWX80_02696 [Candidatus Hydrogenedentes bacterium ADurb.Bin101]|nr:MAG: hypothetical protein BWX80_02696 [Candidatus Hydrogenedentes bacterium ADurb.Bin101]